MDTFDPEVRTRTQAEFRAVVNLTPAQHERWLQCDESKAAGERKRGQSETTGHASGRRIVEIRGKKNAELTDSDYRHMRKVVGYVRRHLAQRPAGDVTDTR